MADNLAITAGAGTNIATDEIGGAHYQRIKLTQGADGSATDVSSAAPLPVVQTGTLNVGTVTAVTGITNALPAGTNNIGDVDIASIAAGDNNIGNVDIVTMPNVVVSTLPAIPAGTNNIGDVDVASIVPGTGATNLGKAEDAAHASGDTGVMVLAVRQDTQADFGADGDYVPLSVDDSGNVRVKATITDSQFQPAGPLTAAESTSVTIATDEGDIPVSLSALPALVAGSATIGKVDHTTTGIGHGVSTVTTAGSDVAIAASTAAKWVTVQAQTDNTGWIAVGASGVDATEATGTGVLLAAGESITLAIDNLADVYIDATVSGEGARYIYGS